VPVLFCFVFILVFDSLLIFFIVFLSTVTGFMLGALQLETMGWLGSLGLAMVPIIWFAAVGSANDKLLLLGGAEFAAAWVFPITVLMYLISPFGRDLRENTGVKLEIHKLWTSFTVVLGKKSSRESPGGELAIIKTEEPNDKSDYGTNAEQADAESPDAAQEESGEDQVAKTGEGEETNDADADADADADTELEEEHSTRQLLGEGLKIMAMDVVIQMCISLSVYLALATDAAEAYQLTALQSALPSYGASKR